MICLSCSANVLALFICDDGQHRCYQCKAKRPVPKPPQSVEPTFRTTPGPKDGVPYVSPYTHKPRRSRIQVLRMIETKLRAKMADIEAQPNWRQGERWSSAHFAYAQAIQIVRDHHVIFAEEKE